MPAPPLRIQKEIPGTDGERIALLNPEGEPTKFRNLIKLRADGTVQPEYAHDDVYVDASFDGRVLTANTWSGFREALDYDSGKPVSRVFVK